MDKDGRPKLGLCTGDPEGGDRYQSPPPQSRCSLSLIDGDVS